MGLCLHVSSSSPDFPNVHPGFTTTALIIITLSSGSTKKYHHNSNLFLTFLEARKSKIKVPADPGSGESELLVHTQPSSHCVLTGKGPESILGSLL